MVALFRLGRAGIRNLLLLSVDHLERELPRTLARADADGTASLVARRDIEAGEEVTVDYALFTTQSNWMLDNRCRCGSPYCRRVVTGDDWRREDVQERYRDHFSPFINRRIERLRKGSLHDS